MRHRLLILVALLALTGCGAALPMLGATGQSALTAGAAGLGAGYLLRGPSAAGQPEAVPVIDWSSMKGCFLVGKVKGTCSVSQD